MGVALYFLDMLALCYKFGVRELQFDWATRTTVAVYDNIYSLIESPQSPDKWVMIFTFVGALVMLVLVICYHRFYWWPIHPIGYLTAYSSAMRILWVSFFIGWLFNALCIRYGGVVLLKGAGTLVCDGGAVYVCPYGNPGMASGGMGDVLSGVLVALLAQGMNLRDAACLGVCLHAAAGDRRQPFLHTRFPAGA